MDQAAGLPVRRGGLVSTVDDFLGFARCLLNRGVYDGQRLPSEHSVDLMTTNHLTREQMASAGPSLGGRGWGYKETPGGVHVGNVLEGKAESRLYGSHNY